MKTLHEIGAEGLREAVKVAHRWNRWHITLDTFAKACGMPEDSAAQRCQLRTVSQLPWKLSEPRPIKYRIQAHMVFDLARHSVEAAAALPKVIHTIETVLSSKFP